VALTPRTFAFRALHLAALSFFALAWPLLELLGRNPEFFVVRGSRSMDIVVLALGLAIVPPLILALVEAVVGAFSAGVSAAIHLVLVALLVATIALLPLSRIGSLPALAALALALALGVAGAVLYARFAPVRSVVTLLGLAPLAFLALFFFGTASGSLVLPSSDVKPADVKVGNPAPVVMVVFDEFPTGSLQDGAGGIDAARFPHFADFARHATWYRNATTVDANTTRAVPAILSGSNDPGAPIVADHPHNLFTLLGGTYQMEVAEAVTRLCPASLCPREAASGFGSRVHSLADDLGVVYLQELLPADFRKRLPSVTGVWGDFRAGVARPGRSTLGSGYMLRNLLPGSVKDREASFETFVRALHPVTKPTLFFIHVLLPHYPWEHVPSGRAYPEFTIPGLTADFWTGNEFEAEQAWQRHIAQVGYVDRLLGQLEQRLRAAGLWDESLVVLVADHGVSFRAGEARKAVTPANAEDLAYMPLFVKAPGQERGRTVDATVSTLDILPSMASILGIRLPWRVQGHSVAGQQVPSRATVSLDENDGGTLVVDSAELERRREERLAVQTRLFGSTWDDLYAFGNGPKLVGKPAAEAGLDEAANAVARLDPQPGDWHAGPAIVPAFVRGSVTGSGAAGVLSVAVVVNGRIGAVVPPYPGSDGPRFSALLPESLFRNGANQIRAVALSAAPSP
jgi:hypothetical protein